MKSQSHTYAEPTLAATVSPEDIACGDFVSPLCESFDVPSYFWDGCGASLSPHELVRLQLIPRSAGLPHKVVAVCLPFVYAKSPAENNVTFDVRRVQLARLDRKCAKQVWKNYGRPAGTTGNE